jgi:hypothetical protein
MRTDHGLQGHVPGHRRSYPRAPARPRAPPGGWVNFHPLYSYPRQRVDGVLRVEGISLHSCEDLPPAPPPAPPPPPLVPQADVLLRHTFRFQLSFPVASVLWSIRTSVCLLFDIHPSPFFRRNHTQIRSERGEQVKMMKRIGETDA